MCLCAFSVSIVELSASVCDSCVFYAVFVFVFVVMGFFGSLSISHVLFSFVNLCRLTEPDVTDVVTFTFTYILRQKLETRQA